MKIDQETSYLPPSHTFAHTDTSAVTLADLSMLDETQLEMLDIELSMLQQDGPEKSQVLL